MYFLSNSPSTSSTGKVQESLGPVIGESSPGLGVHRMLWEAARLPLLSAKLLRAGRNETLQVSLFGAPEKFFK